jgi:hypothetical protein
MHIHLSPTLFFVQIRLSLRLTNPSLCRYAEMVSSAIWAVPSVIAVESGMAGFGNGRLPTECKKCRTQIRGIGLSCTW